MLGRLKWLLDWLGRLQLAWALVPLVVGAVALVFGWLRNLTPLTIVAVALLALDAVLFLAILAARWRWRHNVKPSQGVQRLEVKPNPVGNREWGYGRAINGRLMVAFVSASVTVRGLAIDEGLIALTCELYRKGRLILALPVMDHTWLGQAKGPQISRDAIFHRTFAQSDQGDAPLATVGEELEPRVVAQFSIDRSITSGVLPPIRVGGPFQPGVRP